MIESEHREFKLRFTEDLYKEVVAFANTGGGEILIGVDDAGQAVGLEHPDDEYTRITNGIRDAIVPDVTLFVRCSIREDRVVCIIVSEGARKPYYLKGKGLKPSGVYVRQGASSVPASFDMIRQMIKDSDGDSFEELRSMDQDLTFEAMGAAFRRYGVPFGPEKYLTLGLTQTGSGLFTNLALLLSDQCRHSIKIGVFADGNNTVFRDQKEFGGSVFTQLEEAFQYLKLCNRTAATFRGLERIDSPDYPEEALREALLNAVVHRDYSYSGSIIINVNDREIGFVSLGGLMPGLTPEDIRSGISQPRNKLLAAVFHRLRLIEAYGTGIRRIYALYADCPMQPRIEITPNTFRMTLPNRNISTDRTQNTPRDQTVVDHIRTHGGITGAELENLLGVKKTRAYTIAREMQERGLITVRGRGKEKRYVLR
ncbi:MAG: putative DNA binding domain-containing protein [Clostridia bacterium]|nr:putative DNA binding domain-containing protein [Clostridia bacterium]